MIGAAQDRSGAGAGVAPKEPWYKDIMQVYTACVATAVLAMIMTNKK